MPELPEVETTCRGILPHIVGKRVSEIVVRNHSLRWPIPKNLPELLKGKTLKNISRRGKYLLFDFKDGYLLAHLGMSGSLRIVKPGELPAKHDHVDIVFGKVILRYHDPRRFGAILWANEAIDEHELIAHMGPEPLTDDFNAGYLFSKSRKRTQAVKTFIMDGRIVVGVGNIYANEALFNSGIHPLKPAGKVSKLKYELLSNEIKTVLANAIKRGGTTLRDFVGGDGKPGYFAQELLVYGRAGEPCVKCEKALIEKRLGQRSTVYCTVCQR